MGEKKGSRIFVVIEEEHESGGVPRAIRWREVTKKDTSEITLEKKKEKEDEKEGSARKIGASSAYTGRVKTIGMIEG